MQMWILIRSTVMDFHFETGKNTTVTGKKLIHYLKKKNVTKSKFYFKKIFLLLFDC